MFAKKSNQKINPWTDLTREKLSDTSGLSVKKQIGDLVSPAKMLDQIFGAKSSNEQYPKIPGREKQPAKQSQENVIFSNSRRSEDIKITQETLALVSELKKHVALLEKNGATAAENRYLLPQIFGMDAPGGKTADHQSRRGQCLVSDL